LSYLEQLFIKKPDYCLQFPNSNKLDVAYLDIEVLTRKKEKRFPKSSHNPIISIGVKLNDSPSEFIGGYEDSQVSDRRVLAGLQTWFDIHDPDVVVGYNSKLFDIPYIVERCEINGIDPTFLDRIKSYSGKFNGMAGRVHFDLYEPASADQSLFGIKSRKLKEVAKWFDKKGEFDLVELNKEQYADTESLLNTPLLREYQLSDVEATARVCESYLPNAIALAEILKVPLNSVVGAWPSFIPKLIIARNFEKLGLATVDDNLTRYSSKLGTMKFEGAIVDCLQTGYIKDITKIDFTSMYPSAIQTWNLGPDTTKLIGLEEYDPELKVERNDRYLILRIPDRNINRSLVVQIDTSQEGFLNKEISVLRNERTEIKKLLKKDPENLALDSRQTAIKVILNSIYGYLGSPYATYGDLASGISITSLCRYTSKFVSSILADSIVNVDTDGFIVTGTPDTNLINTKIADKIRSVFGLESKMVLETEPLHDGFFYKMKNYIIRKMVKGKLEIVKHGVKFKSSRQAEIYDDILEAIIKKVFDGKPSNEYQWYLDTINLKQYDLDKFKFRLKYSRELDKYAKGLSQGKQLAYQLEEIVGIDVVDGTQVDFYVTKKPPNCKRLLDHKKYKSPYYTIAEEVNSVNDLDLEWYKQQINKLFELFEWDYKQQLRLF